MAYGKPEQIDKIEFNRRYKKWLKRLAKINRRYKKWLKRLAKRQRRRKGWIKNQYYGYSL
jgi:hypothetical protein